jgi:hypothetical protein
MERVWVTGPFAPFGGAPTLNWTKETHAMDYHAAVCISEALTEVIW